MRGKTSVVAKPPCATMPSANSVELRWMPAPAFLKNTSTLRRWDRASPSTGSRPAAPSSRAPWHPAPHRRVAHRDAAEAVRVMEPDHERAVATHRMAHDVNAVRVDREAPLHLLDDGQDILLAHADVEGGRPAEAV